MHRLPWASCPSGVGSSRRASPDSGVHGKFVRRSDAPPELCPNRLFNAPGLRFFHDLSACWESISAAGDLESTKSIDLSQAFGSSPQRRRLCDVGRSAMLFSGLSLLRPESQPPRVSLSGTLRGACGSLREPAGASTTAACGGRRVRAWRAWQEYTRSKPLPRWFGRGRIVRSSALVPAFRPSRMGLAEPTEGGTPKPRAERGPAIRACAERPPESGLRTRSVGPPVEMELPDRSANARCTARIRLDLGRRGSFLRIRVLRSERR